MDKIAQLYDLYLSSKRVSTDTRTIEKGDLFFALKGPSFDGNQYAEKALLSGAKAVVVDDPKVVVDERYFLVADVLVALQQLANHHRKQLDIPVIGLTGSNGKTTTKELLVRALSGKYVVQATYGNLNNHIGVPLTLLSLKPGTSMAIIEMGASKQGDIDELCRIALPTHGLITNIGRAHLEGMGGTEGVLKTKTELFQYLLETGGQVFINSSQKIFTNMIRRFDQPVLFPGPSDFCQVTFEGANPHVTFSLPPDQTIYVSNLIGHYNFDNIAAALCVAQYFEVSLKEAAMTIAAYVPENMRSQVIEKRSNIILLDAYNANPSSMEAALRAFDKLDKRKHKMVILGDMYELGEYSKAEHEKVGELVNQMRLDKICFTGKDTQYALSKAPKALYFPDPFSLRNWLRDSNLEDYQILIKGSRGMKLEGLLTFV
ncbi:UDP-N-acetylmuramoyl-tripeptide--D-alanyl-D-alanine ligase [Cyclobacterium marinum]|uniref:UDP-N-acetylmuramoyl-tripeptide--D-alanyl-D- alanine ligase n=1 Tax=Cyclobacterium marinum TaxID=104 RepID=UPI0011EFFF8C|nr:UDP-N-acetylmuramoyl-tripeptide--D-alanyl-D-alanine ligase [Cyclobacterium marinum]MBI0399569.1 UDP-N-acetylmuramoyl-tripeptide--D-alanyl-D-alanine ligase [Cyclobacterium marinum]